MSPGVAMMPVMQAANAGGGSFSEMASFFEKQRQQIEAAMDAKDAKMEQQRKEMEARLEQQHAAALARAEARVGLPSVAAVSEEQLSHLQTRLEGLHMTKLLSDDELFALEDSVADWVRMCSLLSVIFPNSDATTDRLAVADTHCHCHAQVEMQASMVDQIVTETMLYATAGHAFGVGVKVHKMLKISAVATGDAAFARQLRRKFL
jgi:hypothetical protein